MCSDWELLRISAAMSVRHAAQHEVLLRQDDFADSVFFLRSGTCRVIQRATLTRKLARQIGVVHPLDRERQRLLQKLDRDAFIAGLLEAIPAP